MFAQAPHLLAMLKMSGSRKKEACDKLHGFELQVGAAGLNQFMKCEGDFPAAFKGAKALCGSGGAAGNTTKGNTTKGNTTKGNTTKGNTTKPGSAADGGHMCNIAKAQVRVGVFAREQEHREYDGSWPMGAWESG